MPAALSSPIDPAVGQLLAAARALGRDGKGILPLLAAFPDPRARGGVRHPVAVTLALAVCAVLAGARSFVAIAEWAADADQVTLTGLAITRRPATTTPPSPTEAKPAGARWPNWAVRRIFTLHSYGSCSS